MIHSVLGDRRAEFLSAHIRCLEIVHAHSEAWTEHAKRHLRRGFVQRLVMMERALIGLDESVGQSTSPLSHGTALGLTILLNSYYLNVCGSLDNLAWALGHELALLPKIDEDDPAHRRFMILGGRDFLTHLTRKGQAELADMLSASAQWYRDVRRFRDPAAHRIPLLIPRSVFDEADVERQREIDQEAAGMFRAGEHQEGMERLYEQFQLGRHLPVFISESPEIEVYDLRKRIASDHSDWLAISNPVMNWFALRAKT